MSGHFEFVTIYHGLVIVLQTEKRINGYIGTLANLGHINMKKKFQPYITSKSICQLMVKAKPFFVLLEVTLFVKYINFCLFKFKFKTNLFQLRERIFTMDLDSKASSCQ